MDSDEDFQLDEFEDGIEEEDDEDFVDMGLEPEGSSHERRSLEAFQFKVLTADEIVKHMVDCIKEVNTVIQVNNYCNNYGIILKLFLNIYTLTWQHLWW